MNRFAFAAALAIGLSSIAQAKVVELVPQAGAVDVSIREAYALPRGISELPEPEVFAMMLVGLLLLGYRARRDSSEKFK